jgi:hypothetical protein
MLPHLDFDLLRANPKAFIGYSDITSLHVPIRQRAGFPTFYGYGLVGMGDKETTAFSRDRLLRVLRGDVIGDVPRDPDDPYVARSPRQASGPLVGGCLWLLMQTLGTRGSSRPRCDPLLRGHRRAAVLRRRAAHAAPARGQARRDRRRRRGRYVPLRLRRPAARGLGLAAGKSIEDVSKAPGGSACRCSTNCPSATGSTSLPFRSVRVTLDADERTLTVANPFQD